MSCRVYSSGDVTYEMFTQVINVKECLPPEPEVDGSREERGEHLRRHRLVLRAGRESEHTRTGRRRIASSRPALQKCRSVERQLVGLPAPFQLDLIRHRRGRVRLAFHGIG